MPAPTAKPHPAPAARRFAATPRWLWWALAACLLAGLWRLGALIVHEPLIALANSYDEVRYSACFGLYPDRPESVPPDRNSPAAPYSRYRFVAAKDPICYWSTELLFQGAAASSAWNRAAAAPWNNSSVDQ